MTNFRHDPSEGFRCAHCRAQIPPSGFGTKHRNHCPVCLWSLHVDDAPGDRAAVCRGPMEPVAVTVRDRGEWAVVHRCVRCHALKLNRIAGDDSERALLALALRPIANPAFPLDALP
ncbi:MAG: RNHCP domain-containing protein [Phycisphaerales bacterium]